MGKDLKVLHTMALLQVARVACFVDILLWWGKGGEQEEQWERVFILDVSIHFFWGGRFLFFCFFVWSFLVV